MEYGLLGLLVLVADLYAIYNVLTSGASTAAKLIWTLVILFLLFVGMFMETLATILILVPVMLPVAYSVGIDPIHFGVVMVCTLGIGFQTPPLGENLFIASGISKISIEEISLRALPFAFINTVAIFVIAFFPEISLWLPRFFGY